MKPRNNNNNNRRKRPDAIDRIIQQYGPEFHTDEAGMDAVTLQRNCEYIIKDIARGYLDYEKNGKYLLEHRIYYGLSSVLTEKYNESHTEKMVFDYYLSSCTNSGIQPDQRIIDMWTKWSNAMFVYSHINNSLYTSFMERNITHMLSIGGYLASMGKMAKSIL